MSPRDRRIKSVPNASSSDGYKRRVRNSSSSNKLKKDKNNSDKRNFSSNAPERVYSGSSTGNFSRKNNNWDRNFRSRRDSEGKFQESFSSKRSGRRSNSPNFTNGSTLREGDKTTSGRRRSMFKQSSETSAALRNPYEASHTHNKVVLENQSNDVFWGRHTTQEILESGRPVHRIWCTSELRSSQRFLGLLKDAKSLGVLVEEVSWAR